MTVVRVSVGVTVSVGAAVAALAITAPAAAAAVPSASVPAVVGLSRAACATGTECSRMSIGSTVLHAGQQLIHGDVGGAAGTLVGGAASTVISTASTALGLAAISFWIVGGGHAVLHDTAAALDDTTNPQLHSTWFSSTYWRMAAIAALLALPFLFAAAVQALIRSDVALLARAAFGYLPLALLVIAIAAPLTTLLLAACDQMCSFISSAAGNESAHFLDRAGLYVSALDAVGVSPFLGFLVGLFLIGAAFTLWVELLLREAAVYVVVLMLPLAFAAFVWPARRIWALRAVELLVALILSKFAIVAVLSLGGAAISTSGSSVTGLMAGAVLILLAAFSPWALLRLIPLAEVAGGAAGTLRGELRSAGAGVDTAMGLAGRGEEWVGRVTADMRREADAQVEPTTRPGHANGAGRMPPTGESSDTTGTSPPESIDIDAEDARDEPPFAEKWSEQPILDLDRSGIGSTQVLPGNDAE